MEYHKIGLRKACRVCGKRVNKAKGRDRSYLVDEHSRELAVVFNIDTSSDCEDTHPLSFCHLCRVFMRSWQTRGGTAPAVGRVFSWAKHTEPTCMVSKRAHTSNFASNNHNVRSVSTSHCSKQEAKVELEVNVEGPKQTPARRSYLG